MYWSFLSIGAVLVIIAAIGITWGLIRAIFGWLMATAPQGDHDPIYLSKPNASEIDWYVDASGRVRKNL